MRTDKPIEIRREDQSVFTVFEKAEKELCRNRRRHGFLFSLIFLLAVAGSVHVGEVSLRKFIEGLPNLFDYIKSTLPTLRSGSALADLGEWYWAWSKWLRLLWDTILMAFLATLIGTVGALILCFPASHNLVKSYWVYFTCRRLMDLARGIPDLVYGLIFVFSFGLGPLPGVLAIAVHSTGVLGKLFSEANENIDPLPVEGVRAAGADWLRTIRYAVVPQVMPHFMSYTLLRFEINIRTASVIGFVGAGGIGQELMLVIRQFIYTDVSAIVLMIVATVVLIDVSCEALRHKMMGTQG